MNYGKVLPYSSESILGSECISCLGQNNNNNNNNNNNDNGNNNVEASEMCQEIYERSVKCEQSMSISSPDTSGCDFIHKQLPKLVNASKAITGRGNKAAKAFAWIFAITTLFFGAYAYYLFRKIKSGKVSLSSQ